MRAVIARRASPAAGAWSSPSARVFALFALALLAGCAKGGTTATCDGGTCSTDAGPMTMPDGGCLLVFSGVLAETDTVSHDCCVVSQDTAANDTLICTLDATQAAVRTQLTVHLGTDPQPGSWSSDTLRNWSCFSAAYGLAGYDCAWSASPTDGGSFTLSLSAILATDGGAPTVHGTAHVGLITATIDTASAGGCGDGTESIDATF